MANADSTTPRQGERVVHDFKNDGLKLAGNGAPVKHPSAVSVEVPPLADTNMSVAGEEDPGAALDMVGGGEVAIAPDSVPEGGDHSTARPRSKQAPLQRP